MDLLGVYSDGSSDEKEEEIKPSVSVSTATSDKKRTVSSNNENTKTKHRKKRKKLDISFLPENIQVALSRGDTANDSDSDNESRSVMGKTPCHDPTAPALISLLPKPKNVTVERGTRIGSDVGERSNNGEANQLHHLGDTETQFDDSVSSSPPDKVDSDPKGTSKVYSASTVSNRVNSAPEVTSTAVPAPRLPVVSSAPPVPPRTADGPSSLPQFSIASDTTSSDTSIYSSASSASKVSTVPSGLHSYAAVPSNSVQQTQSAPRSVSGANNRRREREIQQSLLRGDVSAVELGASVVDVRPTEWDRTRYEEQQSRQNELNSIFNFSQKGGDKMLAQPTKLQNKRHQINSLAFNAAESELELLEARGRQLKSKYETQAKYGW